MADGVADSSKVCKTCEQDKPLESFPKYGKDKKRTIAYRPHCKSCTYKKEKSKWTESKKEKVRAYHRAYHRKNPDVAKIKAYQSNDRSLKRKSIKLKEARELISNNNCFYCGEEEKRNLGLDRMDNSKGHEIGNVKVCCEKCNILLSDIPFEAKLELKEGLTRIRKKEFLKKWEIPSKRQKRRTTN